MARTFDKLCVLGHLDCMRYGIVSNPCAKDENRFHCSWAEFGGLGWRPEWGLSGELAEPSPDHHRHNLHVHSLGLSSTKHGILLYSTDTD
jgi:hypothetical protein